MMNRTNLILSLTPREVQSKMDVREAMLEMTLRTLPYRLKSCANVSSGLRRKSG